MQALVHVRSGLRAVLLALVLPALLLPALMLSGGAAKAQQPVQQPIQETVPRERVEALLDLMAIDQIIAIMREEGLAYGAELGADMLRGGGGAAWDMQVARIYDQAWMRATVRDRFVETFAAADPAPLIAFFETETGREVVRLEIAARRAFMDETVEEGAREAYRAVAADLSASSPRGLDPHLSAIDAYVTANDLVGFNVMGAMNANRLFFRGLVDGGAMEMTDADIMSDIRAQYEQTEAETREWIYAFLMLAYAPLEAGQINDLADLSQTPHGRALNSALFDSFDLMYGALSQSLGAAMAGQMLSEEL